jgi:hypothetical protein
MYQLVYRKVVLCMKLVWCSLMNTCLCEHVFDDVFNQFLSMCLMIMACQTYICECLHVFVNV